MKKLMILLMAVVLISFVLAETPEKMIKAHLGEELKERAELRAGEEINLSVNGSKVRLRLEEGFRLHQEGVEVRSRLNLSEGNGSELRARLSNGKFAEIKVMPSVASERALERLRLKVCNEGNNCSIELKEVGQDNETRPAYEVQAERHFRILGMFRTKARVRAEIDAENGEIVRVNKPWWAFLATEPEESEEE